MSLDTPAHSDVSASATAEPPVHTRFEVKPELFPRSVDALAGDRFLPVGTSLFVTLVLLAAWIAWLFGAPIAVSVSSRAARVEARPSADSIPRDRSVEIVAVFDSKAAGRLKAGQSASMRFEIDAASRQSAVDATVIAVEGPRSNGDVEVTLRPRGDRARDLAGHVGVTGTVDIDLEHATPAALVLRAFRSGSPRSVSGR